MTLKDAKKVRDEVKKRGLWCIVPLSYGPANYFAQIYHGERGPIKFHSLAEARAYLAGSLRGKRKRIRDLDALINLHSRSPIQRMIDQACGLP